MGYIETSNRKPDFRVKYKWVKQSQNLFQHMRSDFRYADDETQNYMIYPEFETLDNQIASIEAKIANEGTATMWILAEETKEKLHKGKIKVGTKGYMVSGSKILANVTVIEVLDGLLG